MDSKELENYSYHLLSEVYKKYPSILYDVRDEYIPIEKLLLSQRSNVLAEVLELSSIKGENSDISNYIDDYIDDIDINSVSLEELQENDFSHFEIAELAGNLTTYPFYKTRFYGENGVKYLFKMISDVIVKNKSLPELFFLIPKEKVKEYFKKKSESSSKPQESNFLLSKSKEFITAYLQYAIFNLFKNMTNSASKDMKTHVFTDMQNSVLPINVLNTAITQIILTDLEEFLRSKDALYDRDIYKYLIASAYAEDFKDTIDISGIYLYNQLNSSFYQKNTNDYIKQSGEYLYNNLNQLISAYPIYTTPALRQQANIVASEVVSNQLGNIVEYANMGPNEPPKDVYDLMDYLHIMINLERNSLTHAKNYTTPYSTTSIPSQAPKTPELNPNFIDILVPTILSTMFLKFISRSVKFVKNKPSSSKPKDLADKTEHTVESLKETLNSLIKDDESYPKDAAKNANIRTLINKLESLNGENPETNQYKELFNKISKSVKAIVSKRTSIER